ncbi:MAG: hypothetical protein AUJ88_06405 [Gallionellaceae bacterium CG1_02_56_997]|nr:MAG: hypothetical protein AUJ88_06405 [Gallionellaceae bacterium CG1_02_56_997]
MVNLLFQYGHFGSLSDLKKIYCTYPRVVWPGESAWTAQICEQPLCGFACLNLFAAILQVRQTASKHGSTNITTIQPRKAPPNLALPQRERG